MASIYRLTTIWWRLGITIFTIFATQLWHQKMLITKPHFFLCRGWQTIAHVSLAMSFGYGSIPINTIFSGMNIHLPAILMFTRGTRFWPTAICFFGVRRGAIASQRGPQNPSRSPVSFDVIAVFNPTNIDSTKGHFTSFYHLGAPKFDEKKLGAPKFDGWETPFSPLFHGKSYCWLAWYYIPLYPNILLVITPITSFVSPY